MKINSKTDYCLACKQCGFLTEIFIVIGRPHHVTSPIWGRIDWPTSSKIRAVGPGLVELEMDKTVHLDFYSLLFGRSKHQFQ